MKFKANLDLTNSNKDLQLANEKLLREMENLKEQNSILKNKVNEFELVNMSNIENKENEKSSTNSTKYFNDSQFKVRTSINDNVALKKKYIILY